MERSEGRHVAGRPASRHPGGSGTIPTLAAEAAAYAAGLDVPMGRRGPGPAGFRNMDETRHAVYRQLVPRARLEDYAAHRPEGADWKGGALECTSSLRKKK